MVVEEYGGTAVVVENNDFLPMGTVVAPCGMEDDQKEERAAKPSQSRCLAVAEVEEA